MRIHIATQLQEKSWGGGNQFLLALQKKFQDSAVYENSLEAADVVIFNSYQELKALIECKQKYPHKKIVYRLGPVFAYHRGKKWKFVDYCMTWVAAFIADGVIFQSEWSKHEFERLGFCGTPHQVIYNAPGELFFSDDPSKQVHTPPRLMSVSWSKHTNKGFELFSKLDTLVGQKQYEMTFIGNAPISFEHIKNLGVQEKTGIISELRSHDIFLAPFRHEACSNAILEALACGLPVVALESGANRELVRKGGEVFSNFEEMIQKIDVVLAHYQKYCSLISFHSISEISQEYIQFCTRIAAQDSRRVSSLRLYFYRFVCRFLI